MVAIAFRTNSLTEHIPRYSIGCGANARGRLDEQYSLFCVHTLLLKSVHQQKIVAHLTFQYALCARQIYLKLDKQLLSEVKKLHKMR